MAVSDFLNSPEAQRQHEAGTAQTYLYFLRNRPDAFARAWNDLDDLTRAIVARRMRAHGATADEMRRFIGGN